MHSAALAEEITTLKAVLAERDGRIEYLEFEMAKLKQLIFGARSERLATLPDPAQLPLWDEQPDDVVVASPVEFKTVVKSPAKGQAKRTALPEHLPREIVVLPLSAEERACPACGEERPVIGYESSERLDYVPAQLKVVETRREKCACSTCQGQLTTAPAPTQIVEQGIPLPGLLAYVLMAKYGYHLPLYRIEQVFAHQGVPIARTTLCDWVLHCGVALKPLTDRLLVRLKQQAVIFSDDTTVAVQDRGKTRETIGYALKNWQALERYTEDGLLEIGRVEMWRGGLRFGLSVAASFVWRCRTSLTITPFPHPARQTKRAALPHPAFFRPSGLRIQQVITP